MLLSHLRHLRSLTDINKVEGKRAKKERWNEAYCQIALSTPAADAFFISLFSFLYYLLSIFNKKFSFAFAFALALVDYPTLREVDVSRTRKKGKKKSCRRKEKREIFHCYLLKCTRSGCWAISLSLL